MGKTVLFQRGKPEHWWATEKATLAEAKEEWSCKECATPICVGEKYIDDVFTNRELTYRYHHRVCLKCWKGPK